MKILVIGGAGYIGSHVVKSLLSARHEVCVYDNLSTGSAQNLFSDAVLVQGDILDYSALLRVMKQDIDAVVFLAAKKAVGESMENPGKYANNNIIGAINTLNAMTEAGVGKIIFSSSAAVYGLPEYLPVDEQHPAAPINFYGFTKLDMENYMKWYDQLKGIKFISLRYFNAVGYDEEGAVKGLEKNPQNLLPIIMETACGIRQKVMIFGNDYDTRDGTCIRDYIHVSDLADAHLKALEYLQKNNQSQIFNLGTENGVSVLEMILKAREVTGKDIPYEFAGRRAGDPAVLLASAQKAQKLLGWTAIHSDLENIIDSTWKLYKSSTI